MPPLGLALTADHAIFLDYRADKYLMLEPELNTAVIDFFETREIADRDLCRIATALGTELTTTQLLTMVVAEPAATFRSYPMSACIAGTSKIAALGHWAVASILLKAGGLVRSLASLERLGSRVSRSDRVGDDIAAIASAHDWLSRHVSAHDACLLRSLALARHALHHRIRVRLTIGVKPYPFSAHCWVSAGDLVLNDDPDNVASFTPILALP